MPYACKHLYGIGRYDPVKIVFLGALGVLSEAGGKYAFTLEYTYQYFRMRALSLLIKNNSFEKSNAEDPLKYSLKIY